MIFKNKKGQIVGGLKDGDFRKQVKLSKHLFRLFDGWGIDASVIETLGENDCKEIRILDTESSTVYKVDFEGWLKHKVDRDFETPQQFVSRKFFETYKYE